MIRIKQCALASLVVLVAAGCERSGTIVPAGVGRSSQILITIEAVAPRHMAPFGGTFAMPKLAGTAASGTIYDDAISTTPVARPALVTILTGLTPDRSGVRDNIHDALPGTVPTIAEQARKSGFETAAFVSTIFASYASGLQRGFDLFDGPEEQLIGPAQYRPDVVPAVKVAEHFKQWLGSRPKDKPFFVWIHLADLNGLATPPPGSVGSSVTKSGDPMEDYDKALAVIDEAIGTIGSAVKNDPGTSNCGVTIVGTHGVYLGESGRRGDAFWLADETLRVPLVRVARVSDPAAEKPKHDPRPTWLPDVAASLGRAIGGAPGGADGVPLEEAPPAGRARLAWTYAPDDQLAWLPLTAVIEPAAFSLFETSSDATVRPRGVVSASATAAAAARPALPRRRELTEAIRAAVERTGVKLGRGMTPAPPPEDVDAWLVDLQIARGFMAKHRPKLAARWTLRLLADAPETMAALETRLVQLATQRSEEGTEIREKLLARYPDHSDVLHWAAHSSIQDLNMPAAAALLDAAIAVGPVEPEVYYDRACLFIREGDVKAGIAELELAIRAGYRSWDWIDKDPDMAPVRANPEFVALLRTHGR